MTTIRYRKSAYQTPVEKGPNGRNLCRWCKTEVKPPKRTFCSDACIHEWRVRTDAAYARRKVYERDHGVCAKCGLDTRSIEDKARVEWERVKKLPFKATENWHKKFRWPWGQYVLLDVQGERREVPVYRSLCEADHIVPVVEGGGECGLENYRTLCLWCHKAETAKLAKRRADARKAEKRERVTRGLNLKARGRKGRRRGEEVRQGYQSAAADAVRVLRDPVGVQPAVHDASLRAVAGVVGVDRGGAADARPAVPRAPQPDGPDGRQAPAA